MRLELKKGINHCMIINDSYSADLNSLEIALEFSGSAKQGIQKKQLFFPIFCKVPEDEQLYHFIIESLKKHNVTRLIGIGEQ